MSRREVLVFEVAGVKLALPLSLVEEVVPLGSVTPVPQSPPFLLGLTAVRGKVMGVIDASRRFSIGPALHSNFLVCRVRGNLTAVTIDRAVVAGSVATKELNAEETEVVRLPSRVEAKFIKGSFELLEESESGTASTGVFVMEVDADLFVSAEMALRTGEA
jgi:chemotaxis signal transduction protein